MSDGPPVGPRTGEVTAFDPEVGWGVVAADDAAFPFHSTAIADGSRTIAVGATVAFDTVPGRMGRWEASALRDAGSSSPEPTSGARPHAG